MNAILCSFHASHGTILWGIGVLPSGGQLASWRMAEACQPCDFCVLGGYI